MEMARDQENESRKLKRMRPARIEIPTRSMPLSGAGLGLGFSHEGVDEEFEVEGRGYWLASKKGTRHAVMEDGYGVMTNINGHSKQALFFGVYDGHGGRVAVDYVSQKLGNNIIASLAKHHHENNINGSLELAVKAAYLATDEEFLTQGGKGGACAATVILIDGELVAANVGDCRIIVSKKGVAVALTSDHRAGREDERIRIENSGGYVICENGVWRVQGLLGVSRAIGDHESFKKKLIISEPDTTRLHLTSDYDFLIMATDGLWDQVSNQEAVDVVLKHEKYCMEACKVLVDLASTRGSRDDITVMLVDLQRFYTN